MARSFTRLFAAALIVLSASVSDAQDSPQTLNQQSVNEMLRLFRGAQDFQKKLSGSLINPDVFDSFEIGNIVFVNLVSDLPSADEAVTDLSKMISVDRAAIHAKPGPEIESLIELMLRRPHKPTLDEVSLSKHGQSGFLWKVNFQLLPNGPFSGILYEYREYVKADGTPLAAKRFFCDRVEVRVNAAKSSDKEDVEKSDRPNETIFSVLSFADLVACNDETKMIHGDEAQTLATSAIKAFFAELLEKDQSPPPLRFRDQSLMDVPITFRDGTIFKRKVWAVNFIHANWTGRAIHDADPFTVWVTDDGFVAQLTRGSWEAKNRRAKP